MPPTPRAGARSRRGRLPRCCAPGGSYIGGNPRFQRLDELAKKSLRPRVTAVEAAEYQLVGDEGESGPTVAGCMAIAAPGPVGWVGAESAAYRVEGDVPHDAEKVVVIADSSCSV